MIRWLVYILCAGLMGLSLASEVSAAASGNANPQTAAQWCYGMIASGNSGAFIEPLVDCFTDATSGIIPSVATNFINTVTPDYINVVTIMFVLALAYYGIRISLSNANIKSETIILGLKMAGVMYFMGHASAIYVQMIGIMQWLGYTISSAAISVHTTGFCVGSMNSGSDPSQWQYGLWSRWDCVFSYILGFAAGTINSSGGFAMASIAAFLMLMIFSMGAGILVFFFGLYLIASLFFTAMRFVHMYIMSVLALSFMFCIGFMFVPLIIFKNTFPYFQKWFSITLGFVLTPVMLFGFMGIALVALDIVLFSGTYSVWCTIGGTTYCGSNTSKGATMFRDFTANTVPAGEDSGALGPTGSGNPYLQDAFKEFFWVTLNGITAIMQGSSGGSAWASGTSLCTSGMSNMGLPGYGCGIGQPGSNIDATWHPEAARIGFDETQLNLGALASGAGSTCTGTSIGTPISGSGSGFFYYSNCPYIENILVSLLVAGLMTYILYVLLNYLPSLTSDLVSQGSMASANLLKTKPFGQSQVMGAIEMAKNTSTNFAQGLQEGGLSSAMKSALQSVKTQAASMATKRSGP